MIVNQPTILNVNDDEASLRAISRMLRDGGFDVREARTSSEAQSDVRSLPDLLVMDLNRSPGRGFDLCHAVKSNPKLQSIPVVQLAENFAALNDPAAGLDCSADAYLTQPVSAEELIATIKALLRLKHAEEDAAEAALRWQSVFDAIQEGVLVIAANDEILQCNRAAARLLDISTTHLLKNTLRNLTQKHTDIASIQQMVDSFNSGKGNTREINIAGCWLQVAVYAIAPTGGYVITLEDITESKAAEIERNKLLRETRSVAGRMYQFMREVLLSVTEGKLTLCDTPRCLPSGGHRIGDPIPIHAETLSELRARIKEAALAQQFSPERWQDLVTAASEAGMNAAVHAGGGSAKIIITDRDKLQVWIEDKGIGITMENLPKATLALGYTTAGTLGHGLKIMLQSIDHTWLLTGGRGTTVVLEQGRDPLLEPPWSTKPSSHA